MMHSQNSCHPEEFAAGWIGRFPRLFDEKLLWNAKFLGSIPYLFSKPTHKLLFAFSFLQKKMESSLEKTPLQHHLFLKLFRHSNRLCITVVFKEEHFRQKESFKKMLTEFLPGSQLIPESFISWNHPTLPYVIWSIELFRLRGKDLSASELKKTEKILLQQFKGTPYLTNCFWPFNKEEAFRNIQFLQHEMKHKNDLPHLSVQFLEHTNLSIEFLICLVRPKKNSSLPEVIYGLPYPISVYCHFHQEIHHPVPMEVGAFSIQVPSDIHTSSTLLRARRHILQQLETVIGPFRDCNGGLLEMQQKQFEEIQFQLGNQCANFDLFAERLFYALHFRDAWLILPIEKMSDLFKAFSTLLDEEKNCAIIESELSHFTLVKSKGDWSNQKTLQQIEQEQQLELCAQFSIDGSHYRCYFGVCKQKIGDSFCRLASPKQEKILRLVFQEGPPPSLNPHYSNVDIRCCVLYKLIFEGLTRIDEQGNPSLAAAKEVSISPDGRCYTFTLKSSRWSNGERVRADHFENSLRCGLSSQVPHPERLFIIRNAKNQKGDLGVRSLNADTLQIELEEPDPFFLHKLSQPSFLPLFGGDREPKWFNGPFFIHEYSHELLVLERNPFFWDAKNIYLERIEIRWTNDIEQIFRLYQEGNLDWIGEPLSILTMAQIEHFDKQQMLIKKTVARRCNVYFNTKTSILASPLVRRALSQVVDTEFITDHIWRHSEPIRRRNRQEPLAESWLQQGLFELGFTKETAPPLVLTISNHTRRKDLALYLQTVWTRLGLRVELQELDWNYFRNQLEKRDFQICITIQDTLNSDSPAYYSKMEGETSWNFSEWFYPPYRKLFEASFPVDNWRALADEMLDVQAPLIPLFQYTHLMAVHPCMRGYCSDQEGCVDFSRTLFVEKNDKDA